MDKKTPTVPVQLYLHTYHGKEYQPGDTYACDEGDVVTVEVQGKAARVDATVIKPAKPQK